MSITKKYDVKNLVPDKLKHPSLERTINKIASQLNMNELEITLWSLWVDKNNWGEPSLSTYQFLFITGFQVKVIQFIRIAIFEHL